MFITINGCFQDRAPSGIMNLIKTRDHKYNLRGNNVLSLPKVNSTKHGLNSLKYYAAKQSPHNSQPSLSCYQAEVLWNWW